MSGNNERMSTTTRARLRAGWIRRIRDMEPDHVVVLVEALRLCAASDRSDTATALDLIGADIRATIAALDTISESARELDDHVAADPPHAARVVLMLQDAIRRTWPQATT